jgi:hypothetical protein
MKKYILIVAFLVTAYSFSQSVNEYRGVIIPLKYDFMKTDNQYRIATLSKFYLEKAGFEAFYTNEDRSIVFNDRCSMLYVNVVKENAFLATKLHIDLNDCNGKTIFKSESSYTKEKDTELAYAETIEKAFESVVALQYKYDNKVNTNVIAANEVTVKKTSVELATPSAAVTKIDGTAYANLVGNPIIALYAQPILNGFQLVNSVPKIVMKAFKTSIPTCLIAIRDADQGVLIARNEQWFFEYYQNDKLISEEINVKF